MWEYRSVKWSGNILETMMESDALGTKGWEMVCQVGHYIMFKRPVGWTRT